MSYEEKKANFTDAMKSLGGHIRGSAMQGLGAAAGGAAVTGVGIAASKLYDAATKHRDFRQMLAANPELQEAQRSMPGRFNQMFTSLRDMVPEFSKDPLIAGEYMKRMTEVPEHAGGFLLEAVQHRDRFRDNNPMRDSFTRAGLEGIKPHSAQSLPYGAAAGSAMKGGPYYDPRSAPREPSGKPNNGQ